MTWRAAVATLKELAAAFVPRGDGFPPGVEQPAPARRATSSIGRSRISPDDGAGRQLESRRGPVAALAGIVDEVLADALMAWAYAISICRSRRAPRC